MIFKLLQIEVRRGGRLMLRLRACRDMGECSDRLEPQPRHPGNRGGAGHRRHHRRPDISHRAGRNGHISLQVPFWGFQPLHRYNAHLTVVSRIFETLHRFSVAVRKRYKIPL